MASGQTTNLGLPQIIGTDLVNSSDINNGFYKIDEHAGVLNAKISKLETESGGSSEELENVNNTITAVRDDITTIESTVNTNTQDIVLLKRHQNESDARIDALEGASGGGGTGGYEYKILRANIGRKATENYSADGTVCKIDVNSIVNGNLTGLQSQGYDEKNVLGIEPTVLKTEENNSFIPFLTIDQYGNWILIGNCGEGKHTISTSSMRIKFLVR